MTFVKCKSASAFECLWWGTIEWINLLHNLRVPWQSCCHTLGSFDRLAYLSPLLIFRQKLKMTCTGQPTFLQVKLLRIRYVADNVIHGRHRPKVTNRGSAHTLQKVWSIFLIKFFPHDFQYTTQVNLQKVQSTYLSYLSRLYIILHKGLFCRKFGPLPYQICPI